MKAILAKYCRAVGQEDHISVVAQLTVEVFHSLYVLNCMQTSNDSARTTTVFILLDLGPNMYHIYKVLSGSIQIGSNQLLTLPTKSLVVGQTTDSHRNWTQPRVAGIGARILPFPFWRESPRVNFQNTELRRILLLCEYHLVVEYVEGFIPSTYIAYIAVLYHLPNRHYHPHMKAVDTHQALTSMVVNVVIFAILEDFSLLLFGFVITKKIGISALHLLAFFLEYQCEMIQSWLFLWVPYCLFFTLKHGECLPLKAPSLGWEAQTLYWVRSFIVILCMSHMFVVDIKTVIPELPITAFQTFTVCFLSSIVHATNHVLLSATWAFPIPFSLVTTAPVLAVVLFGSLFLVIGRERLDHVNHFRTKAFVFVGLMSIQLLLVLVYPAYNTIFIQLDSVTMQTLLLFTLPVIKLCMKSLLLRCAAPAKLDDELPQLMIFTVDLFNALYLTACMQASNIGKQALLVVMLIDAVFMTRSIRGIFKRGRHLKRVLRVQNAPLNDFMAFVERIYRQNARRMSNTAWLSMHHYVPTRSVAPAPTRATPVVPMAPVQSRPSLAQMDTEMILSAVAGSSEVRNLLIYQALRTLFNSEYLVLMEYVEVIIPFIAAVHTFLLYHLPNKAYYSSMNQYTDDDKLYQMLENVVFYIGLGILSLLVLWVIVRRKLRHSVLFQLAFVLERNFAAIQTRLMAWVSLLMLFPIDHAGNDFTFRFEWMRHHVST
ncbi:hypothetical protein Poli38472_013013 [Pythium oligandrum]|uniref:Uncharacterized protein n=1 Tax=Pythium oligandrum TaxID=41045 RepID=A0A8K1CKH1_PYTOL|nr:hypothetical protein Poli38472_013013 [Pythium oligandrum]|eukprot:TMW64391.1 hypothetical protein Poli38472_013013 [Pythium oligandrum]